MYTAWPATMMRSVRLLQAEVLCVALVVGGYGTPLFACTEPWLKNSVSVHARCWNTCCWRTLLEYIGTLLDTRGRGGEQRLSSRAQQHRKERRRSLGGLQHRNHRRERTLAVAAFRLTPFSATY